MKVCIENIYILIRQECLIMTSVFSMLFHSFEYATCVLFALCNINQCQRVSVQHYLNALR